MTARGAAERLAGIVRFTVTKEPAVRLLPALVPWPRRRCAEARRPMMAPARWSVPARLAPVRPVLGVRPVELRPVLARDAVTTPIPLARPDQERNR